MGGKTASRNTAKTAMGKTTKRSESRARSKGKKTVAKDAAKGSKRGEERSSESSVSATGKIAVHHVGAEIPDGLPKKFVTKSTFNTHDIMHSPVEKTLKMIDEILAGERLFTM